VSLYLDASVILPTLNQEPASAEVQAFLAPRREGRLISECAAAEVASGLSRLVRMRALSEAEAVARLTDFEAWRATTATAVDVVTTDVRLAYAFVRRFDLGLRALDALHLAIARRLDATLVTLDRRLSRAAGELGIEIAMPTSD
jgi:hypothetical protein